MNIMYTLSSAQWVVMYTMCTLIQGLVSSHVHYDFTMWVVLYVGNLLDVTSYISVVRGITHSGD
jgi:hypothetical protein